MTGLSGEYRYSYDVSNRLCVVEKDGEILRSYTYDGYGNRIQMRKGEEEYFYSYNSLNQLLAVEGSRKQSYFYDKRGNLINQYNEGEKFAEYVYDATNRLEASWQNGGVCSRYSYNGLGHRVSRKRKEPTKEGILQHSLLEEYVIDLTKLLLGGKRVEQAGGSL